MGSDRHSEIFFQQFLGQYMAVTACHRTTRGLRECDLIVAMVHTFYSCFPCHVSTSLPKKVGSALGSVCGDKSWQPPRLSDDKEEGREGVEEEARLSPKQGN